jgi:hypothetical protein
MLLLFITFCWLTAKATGTALAKIEVEELSAHLSSRFLNMTTDYEFPHCACKVWGKTLQCIDSAQRAVSRCHVRRFM